MLVALGAFACDGRYVIGSAPDGVAGTSSGGQGDAGQPGAQNNSGESGNGGSIGADGGAVGASGRESLGGAGEPFVDPGPPGRVRWLAVETFPSSASTQTLLNLVDLRQPTWSGVTVESTSVIAPLPSPDGRWILYASYRKSESLGDVYDYYVVNTAGKTPGARQLFLADQTSWSLCSWSPDASRVACSKTRADVDSGATHLVLFGAAGSTWGAEVDVAPIAGSPVFLDPSALAYSNLQGELMRLDWGSIDAPAEPTALGVTADQVAVSSHGERAMAHRNEPESDTLFDVHTGASESIDLPVPVVLSHSFGAALSSVSDADTGKRTYTYYAVNGLHLSPVGQREVTMPAFAIVPLQMAERSVVVADDDRLVFTYVPETGEAAPQTVPGDYAVVQKFALDPTGRYLYFSSAERAAGVVDKSTTQHWVSRLGPAGAEPPHLLTEGFAAATAVFSPDGQRLLLAGDSYNDVDPQPTPIHLYTLSEGETPRDRLLPLPLNWLSAVFSRDSSYLAFYGGSRLQNNRPLYALDLLLPDATPQLLYSCGSNPAPLPGCPNGIVF